MTKLWKHSIAPVFGLFTSLGTLVCCALPALFVTLGMGAALAGLVSNAPWLVALSEHKTTVFTVAGLLLSMAVILQWRARHVPCPSDVRQARICMRLRRLNIGILTIAIVIYGTGFFFAFIAADLFYG